MVFCENLGSSIHSFNFILHAFLHLKCTDTPPYPFFNHTLPYSPMDVKLFQLRNLDGFFSKVYCARRLEKSAIQGYDEKNRMKHPYYRKKGFYGTNGSNPCTKELPESI